MIQSTTSGTIKAFTIHNARLFLSPTMLRLFITSLFTDRLAHTFHVHIPHYASQRFRQKNHFFLTNPDTYETHGNVFVDLLYFCVKRGKTLFPNISTFSSFWCFSVISFATRINAIWVRLKLPHTLCWIESQHEFDLLNHQMSWDTLLSLGT